MSNSSLEFPANLLYTLFGCDPNYEYFNCLSMVDLCLFADRLVENLRLNHKIEHRTHVYPNGFTVNGMESLNDVYAGSKKEEFLVRASYYTGNLDMINRYYASRSEYTNAIKALETSKGCHFPEFHNLKRIIFTPTFPNKNMSEYKSIYYECEKKCYENILRILQANGYYIDESSQDHKDNLDIIQRTVYRTKQEMLTLDYAERNKKMYNVGCRTNFKPYTVIKSEFNAKFKEYISNHPEEAKLYE